MLYVNKEDWATVSLWACVFLLVLLYIVFPSAIVIGTGLTIPVVLP